jgi:hypothetical protein
MKLEFRDSKTNSTGRCSVYFKGVLVFEIYYEEDVNKYWICSGRGFIEFRYFGFKPDDDLDFIEPHKYSKTLEGAKNNCKKIMYSYINWLTEK